MNKMFGVKVLIIHLRKAYLHNYECNRLFLDTSRQSVQNVLDINSDITMFKSEKARVGIHWNLFDIWNGRMSQNSVVMEWK